MKVSYPDKKGNDLRFANEYGKYLISNNNTWHGGVHLEGANIPIRAIADGRIIAYRLEEDYKEIQRAYNINFDSSQKDKKQKKLLYSNSFVLVQHDLVLEKEEIKNKGTAEESTEIKKKTVVFYSLYNHLMCLNDLVDKDLPNYLSSKSFSVRPSVKNIMRGIEVYPLLKKEETAVYLRDKENKVFLPLGTSFSFAEDVDENHPNELQVEKPKKGGGVTQVTYKRIIITDDTIEKDSNKAYYIIGKSSGIYKKEETTHKAKIIGVYDKLDREIKGGSVFELPDTGSKLLKIIVKGEKLITVSEEGLSKKWYKLSEGGYIQKTQVLDRNTLDDSKFKRGKIEACDIPIKSDNIIGYTGAMNSEEAPDYYACQLDVFMTDDVNSFLENEFEAGKASDNKYTILPKDTELKQWISLDGITLKRGLEVKVLALKGGYAKVKIPKIITRTLTDKEINLSKNKRTYRKYSEVKDEEIIDFNSINRKFGGVLTKEKDLLFYGKKRTANNISVYCTPEHGGKELWIPYSSLDETAEFEIVKERRTHYKSIFNASKTKDYLSRVLLQKEEKSGSKKVLVNKNSTDKKKEKDNPKKIERVVPRYLLGTYSKEKAQTFSCREKNFDRLNKLFDNQLLNSQARLTWMYACDKGGNKIEKDSDNKYPTPYRKVSYNLEAHQSQQLQEQAFIREGEWSEPSSVTDYISRPEEQQDPSIFKDILSAKEEPISSEEKLVNVPEKKGEVSKLNDYVSRPNLGSSEQSFFDTLTLGEEPILHPIENEIVCVVPRRLLGDYKKGYYTCKKSTYEELNKLFDYQLLGDTAKLYLIKVYGKKSKEVKKVGNTYSKAYRKVKYKIREHDEELNYIETKKHIGCHQAKIGESVSLLKDESDVFLVVGTNEEKEGYCTEKAVVIDTSYGEEIQIEDKDLTYKEVQIDYTMGNKSVIKKGWIERKILKEKNYFSAYDWYKFGFTSIKNGGREFMFKIKGLRDEKQTDSEFVDGVWGVLDIDKNNTIDLTDVKGIYSTKETQEVLSKLVWKHKTEWSYSYEDIEGDVRNYYESKIDFLRKNQAPENVINLVEKAKDIKLEELKKQVGNLMFWKEASGLTYSDGSAKQKSSLPKKSKSGLSVIEDIDPSTGACTIYYESPTDPEDYPVRDENNLVDLLAPPKKEVVARVEERKKIEDAKLKRIFPNTDMVYHFHPIAFVNHMKKIFGGGSSGVCYAELRVRAFMRMIRKCEGTDKEIGYQTLFGHKLFSDYNKDMSTHPNQPVSAGGYTSEAAGAYQILKSTFDGLQQYTSYGIKGFDEKAQDELCVTILKHNYRGERHRDFFYTKKGIEIESRKKFRGVKADIIQKIIDNDINYALLVSCLCWASLPKSPYGQPVKTLAQVKRLYSDYLIEEIKGNTTLHLEPGFLQKFGYNCCSDSSSMMPPWLEIALSKAIMGNGVHESLEPVYSFAKRCLIFSGNQYAPTHSYGQWCGAFISWCLGQAGYKTGSKGGQMTNSQQILALAEKGTVFKVIEKPIVGCIVVMSNYNDNMKSKYEAGEKPTSGHVTLLYGVDPKDEEKYVCVGGNQTNTIKFTPYHKTIPYVLKKNGVRYGEQRLNSFIIPADYPESAYNYNLPKISTSKANKKYETISKSKVKSSF